MHREWASYDVDLTVRCPVLSFCNLTTVLLLSSLWYTCCLVCSFLYDTRVVLFAHFITGQLPSINRCCLFRYASCSVCSFHYRSSPANHHRCLFLYEMFVIPFAHFSIWLTTPTPPSPTTTKNGCTHTNPTTKKNASRRHPTCTESSYY